ncbi:MAG: tetratricopeptide repeat protein [Nitrospiraceae bacterium]|nr:tetratricopeptide repeat protein [Nitrospiraceae bacterium]
MDADELFEKAQRYFLKGKYKESVRVFSEVVEAGYEPAITFMSRGVSYLRMNEREMAIQDFDRAIGIDDRDAAAYYFRGSAHMLGGDYTRALSDFNRAIERNPEHRAALLARGVSYVSLGRNAEGARDISKAMRYAEAAIQGFSDMTGWRGQLEKVLAAMEGEKKRETEQLTEEDIKALKYWLKAA